MSYPQQPYSQGPQPGGPQPGMAPAAGPGYAQQPGFYGQPQKAPNSATLLIAMIGSFFVGGLIFLAFIVAGVSQLGSGDVVEGLVYLLGGSVGIGLGFFVGALLAGALAKKAGRFVVTGAAIIGIPFHIYNFVDSGRPQGFIWMSLGLLLLVLWWLPPTGKAIEYKAARRAARSAGPGMPGSGPGGFQQQPYPQVQQQPPQQAQWGQQQQ